jgi:dTDP-4-dehydrorhamnose reductase
MSNPKVLVLGASGMLGSMVTDSLSRDEQLSVSATMRSPELITRASERIKNVKWLIFEVKDRLQTTQQLRQLGSFDWIINAIGVIKPYARDDQPKEVEHARILQIATDCVYSGTKGCYVESDRHDALDTYGKTKSLGEVSLPNVHHLRCSIIGPEPKSYVSLLEWFRRQPPGAKISGFTNHLWNGVTTLHFAKICHGIMKNDSALGHLQHVIPGGDITKNGLLRCFARCYGRSDVKIAAADAPQAVDRTLATENEQGNILLWKNTGYQNPPRIEEMVEELADFEYRLEGLAK